MTSSVLIFCLWTETRATDVALSGFLLSSITVTSTFSPSLFGWNLGQELVDSVGGCSGTWALLPVETPFRARQDRDPDRVASKGERRFPQADWSQM